MRILFYLSINFYLTLGYSADYIRFSLGNSIFDDSNEIVESFSFDEKNYYFLLNSGVGLVFDKCSKNYECFFYKEVKIVIPNDCELISKNSWSYEDINFSIVGGIDAYNPFDSESRANARVIVEVSKSKKKIGYFLYSSNEGVHSFNFSTKKRKARNIEFHKSSLIGMFPNGCVLKEGQKLYKGGLKRSKHFQNLSDVGGVPVIVLDVYNSKRFLWRPNK